MKVRAWSSQWPNNLNKKVTLEELIVSSLAMSDALAKLCMAKGFFTDAEFRAALQADRANYLAVLTRLH